jgi:hypothetical protein
MSLFSRLKEFYKVWLEPPGVRRLRTRDPAPQTQKMWFGSPVAPPPVEKAYFDAMGLDCTTLTRRDDSRAVGLVRGAITLPVSRAGTTDAVQLAVTADAWLPDSSVSFTIDGRTTRHRALEPGHWLDVRLDDSTNAQSVRIEADQPLWVSRPRGVKVRSARGRRGYHVIVMVLDGMSRRLLAERHPTDESLALTPNLQRFFASGMRARTGYSVSDWTLPTTASFFTGIYPSRHRMVHPVRHMYYPPERPMLAEIFQEAGYHTLGLSAGNRLTPAFGAHRGIDRFIYHWAAGGRTTFDYEPTVWANEIYGHLALHENDSTFTYAHFPDTHPAWDIPPLTRAFNLARRGDSTGHTLRLLEKSPLGREQGRQLLLLRLHELDRALDGVLRYIDEQLGDRAIVVLTADHGTPWHDFPHATSPTRPSLNEFRIGTSMFLRGPGVPAGERTSLVCPNLDLMPTLLGLTGLQAPQDIDGVDLVAEQTPRPHIVSESVYRDVYEVAVSDQHVQWIEKYRLDEDAHKVSGDAFYRGLFPAGCTDYSAPGPGDHAEYAAAARAHIERIGLRG